MAIGPRLALARRRWVGLGYTLAPRLRNRRVAAMAVHTELTAPFVALVNAKARFTPPAYGQFTMPSADTHVGSVVASYVLLDGRKGPVAPPNVAAVLAPPNIGCHRVGCRRCSNKLCGYGGSFLGRTRRYRSPWANGSEKTMVG